VGRGAPRERERESERESWTGTPEKGSSEVDVARYELHAYIGCRGTSWPSIARRVASEIDWY
jgi:hypothetical protein